MTIEIFEKHPTADAYKVGAAFTEYCILAKDKRFSDAELAAEYWKLLWDRSPFRKNGRNVAGNRQAQYDAMSRFARRPHAHETDYR